MADISNRKKMLDIWFFVGLILLIYGLIIALTGVYYIFGPKPTTSLGETNPCLWWGGVLIGGGIFFQILSHFLRRGDHEE